MAPRQGSQPRTCALPWDALHDSEMAFRRSAVAAVEARWAKRAGAWSVINGASGVVGAGIAPVFGVEYACSCLRVCNVNVEG